MFLGATKLYSCKSFFIPPNDVAVILNVNVKTIYNPS